ncbi:MAG TPA: homoserine O-acetyltransferase [bacterium]|nr:homoserine O-acetyltransferase [bacterium]
MKSAKKIIREPWRARESVGIVSTRHYTFAQTPREMTLDSGLTLGPITLAYETYGELNRDKSNAVLICHALSGDAHAAGYHDKDDNKTGWWDLVIGPGKPFDTNKYFVICSNIIGGCKGSSGPSSINPRTGEPYGLQFPVITIADMVRAQHALIQHLGVKRLLNVVGGSMGGMQALQWAVDYPDMVGSATLIATCAKLSAQGIAFNAVGRRAIMSDPAWKEGRYYGGPYPNPGLSLARMIAHITYLSDESLHEKFGRRLQDRDKIGYTFTTEFQVESYLDHQGESFIRRFDANSYLYITKAMDYFDLTLGGARTLARALAGVKSRFLVISFSSDWLYPSEESKEIVRALKMNNADVASCEIQSNYGHDSFLLPCQLQEEMIARFLAANLKGNGVDLPATGACLVK